MVILPLEECIVHFVHDYKLNVVEYVSKYFKPSTNLMFSVIF